MRGCEVARGRTTAMLMLLISVLVGCIATGSAAAAAAASALPAVPVTPKHEYRLRSATVSEVYLRAAQWAKDLDANPLRIEKELKMKGTKHFVEYISLLHELQPTANATVRAWAREAFRAAHVWATQPEFHDDVMSGAVAHKTQPKKFRADSISYLRAAMYFTQAGLDVSYYRERIAQLKPILDEHVPTRGTMQRLAFALLYEELGLEAGRFMQASFDQEMRKAWAVTSIATRKPLEWYLEPGITPSRIYQITHEVFETTNTGNHPFTLGEPDRVWGLEMLVQLMDFKHRQMNSRRERSLDADHLCELVMSYACFADTRAGLDEPERSQPDPRLVLPEHHVDALVRAMADILPRQLPEGSFGTLFTPHFAELNKKYHKNPKHDARIGAALHCTSVCLRACSLIIRFPQVSQRVFAPEPGAEAAATTTTTTAATPTAAAGSAPAPPPPPVPTKATETTTASVAARQPVTRGALAAGVGYGARISAAGGFLPRLVAPSGQRRPQSSSGGAADAAAAVAYQRRGRSDDDLSPSGAFNDPTRSEDIVREVRYVMEAHGEGFRRELLEDVRMTLLDSSDDVVVW